MNTEACPAHIYIAWPRHAPCQQLMECACVFSLNCSSIKHKIPGYSPLQGYVHCWLQYTSHSTLFLVEMWTIKLKTVTGEIFVIHLEKESVRLYCWFNCMVRVHGLVGNKCWWTKRKSALSGPKLSTLPAENIFSKYRYVMFIIRCLYWRISLDGNEILNEDDRLLSTYRGVNDKAVFLLLILTPFVLYVGRIEWM